MLANNSRHRIVTFRLSSDEYESVFFACQAEGARTVSEFARDSVLGRARRDGTGPQSVVKWLMAVTEELSLLSRQTAEIIPLIRAQQITLALSEQLASGESKDKSPVILPAQSLDNEIASDVPDLSPADSSREKETKCD